MIKLCNVMVKLCNIISVIFILCILYAAFMPLQLTRYTLSDGDHTIVFQSMIHIGNPDFYKHVESDAVLYTNDGYTFLYEGIKPGKIDIHNKANVPSYDMVSYELGLESQSINSYFDVIRKIKGINADVDTDWILDQYAKNNLKVDNSASSQSGTKEEKDFIDRHKILIESIGRPLSRLGSRFSIVLEKYNETIGRHSVIMDIILVKRNEVLYNAIQQNLSHKIYINYGAMHFYNLYDMLKKNNPNWHIVEEKNYSAF